MLTIQYAKNPIYSNQKHTTIDLIVKFEEFNEELPFTAVSTDVMNHGVELFNRAIAGEFGTIANYVPPAIDKNGNATQAQPVVTGTQTL
jgi:hypothetical protein